MKNWRKLASNLAITTLSAAALLPALHAPAQAASSSFSCSVEQGFNFQKDSQETVGHLTYLKIGDMVLKADFKETDPENSAKQVGIVGVLSGIQWNGGYAEPVTFAAQVSAYNQKTMTVLMKKKLTNTEVEFGFNVYDYDRKAKKYYKAFHSNSVRLQGLVLKQGGELAFNIAADAAEEVTAPKNFTLQLGVMPQDTQQEIHLGFSCTDKLVKTWGVTVGAGLIPWRPGPVLF